MSDEVGPATHEFVDEWEVLAYAAVGVTLRDVERRMMLGVRIRDAIREQCGAEPAERFGNHFQRIMIAAVERRYEEAKPAIRKREP